MYLNNDYISWGATGALPSTVQTCMENLGYTSIHQFQDTSLTSGVILDVIDMLCDDKPVIMCGWSLPALWHSHYWIVDGIRGSVNSAQIHINWGWGGIYNGWFSRDCIRTTSGADYDSPTKSGGSSSGNAWSNLVTFTYNIPYTGNTVSIHNLYDNKVSY